MTVRICSRCGKKELVKTREPVEDCRDCRIYLSNEKRKKKLKKEKRCINCGKKVSPVCCPHCKKPVKYKIRCKKCLDKALLYQRQRKKEPKGLYT